MALTFAVVTSLVTPSVWADVPSDVAAQAEALFQEGRQLMADGKYDEACPKLRASMDLDPGYGTLFNLAECHTKQGKTATAWAAYKEAAGMAQKMDQPDRVEKANRYAAELEPALLRITIVVTNEVPGLEVKRNGVTVPRATWGTSLPVDPGKHIVEATAPGRNPWKAEVETVGTGGTVTVQVPLLVDGKAGPAVVPEEDPHAPRRYVGLAIGGLGIAALATGAVLGGLASSKWTDAKENHCRTPKLCDAEGVALASDALTFANASTGLFIGGAILTGVGVTLFATSRDGSKPQSTGNFTVLPMIGQTNGLVLEQRF